MSAIRGRNGVAWARRGASVRDRLLALIQVDDNGCWVYPGCVDASGYGRLRVGGRHGQTLGVHRLSYLTFVGPIPDDMTVDHLCFVTRCFNPDHLRLLTPYENAYNHLRTFATHCKRGHEFTRENTALVPNRRKPPGEGNLHRCCRACQRERDALRRAS